MKNSPKGVGAVVLAAIAVAIFHTEAGAVPADAHFRSSYLVLNAETSETASRPFALGDVNNDQAMDLVLVGGQLSASVRVYLGDGYGNFTAPLKPNGPMTSGSVQNPFLADLNGDHRLDLILTSTGPQVTVQLGHGDGTFDAPIATATSEVAHYLAVGDMNEDGIPDLVAGWHGFDVLLGDGSGHFTKAAHGGYTVADHTVLSDMNADGHLDVVLMRAYFPGNGHGGVGPVCGTYAEAGLGSVAVADLDADGNMDIVSAADTYLRLTYSVPGSVFPSLRDTSYYYGGGIRSVVARDLDGDGRDEVILGTSVIEIHSIDARGRIQLRQTLPAPNNSGGGALDVADVNGDGRLDLVQVWRQVTAVYLADAPGHFAAAPSLRLGTRTGRAVSGRFSTGAPPSVAVLLPDADSLAIVGASADGTPILESGVNVGHGAQALASGDFDGDGLDDLVLVKAASASVAVLRNHGGTWKRIDIPGVPNTYWVTLADLDQDGRLDIVTRDASSGAAYVLPGVEDGFNAPMLVADPGMSGALGACEDANGDGDPDLVLDSYTGSTRLFPFAGTTGFAFSALPMVGVDSYYPAQAVCLADLNRDGWKDVLLPGAVAKYKITAGGAPLTFGSWTGGFGLTQYAPGANALAFTDLDGDGWTEVVETSSDFPLVATFRVDPPPSWDIWPELLSYGFGYSKLDQCLVTDITGDGFADLVVTEPDAGTVWIAPRVPYATTSVVPVSPVARGAVTFVSSAPNPLRSTATLQFRLGTSSRATVVIIDTRGRIVRRFPDQLAPSVDFRTSWDGLNDEGVRVKPGVYFARVLTDTATASGKLIVL